MYDIAISTLSAEHQNLMMACPFKQPARGIVNTMLHNKCRGVNFQYPLFY
jgi:hypothetical protein